MGIATYTMIELRNVSFAYRTDDGQPRAVLRNLDLQIGEGEFVCILGPSGCGKSTLLNLIAGFLRPDSGQVLFAGRQVDSPGCERSVVFQDPTLFPWLTTRGNVEFGLRGRGNPLEEIRSRGEEAMWQVGLAGSEDQYPHALSGGMRQRAALARVLALEPPSLLMDEPFGSLDIGTREQLQDLLLQIWQRSRQTILFVTHNVEEAAYLADRVIVIGPAPGGVRAERTVEISHPRNRNSPHFRQVVTMLRECLDGISPLSRQDQGNGHKRKGTQT